MFKPKFTITNSLLFKIKQINSLILELNRQTISKVIFYELEKTAREISAFASTSIEGNPLPLTDVKQILKFQPQNLQKSQQEVVNYNQALLALNKRIKKSSAFNLNLLLSIHKQVVNKLMAKGRLGKLRTEPVFVNNPKRGQTVYWPPDAKDVSQLMDDLINFVNNNKEKIDPLIIAGLFHKQFVIIHPFMDGNGRTVRLATKVLLKNLGLDTFNLFSFENYYNRNVTNYFDEVGVLGNYYEIVDSIDFTPWLEYFSDGIIDELLRVKKLLSEAPIGPKTEIKPYHQKILEYLKENGYIKNRDYAKLTKRAKATRNIDFNKLIKMGLIKRKGKGRAAYYTLKEY